MSDTSAIAWTDATWNPVTGCTKVSQGCKNCYALREWPRLSAPRPQPNIYTGRALPDVMVHPERLDQPLRWAKPRRIFVNSMSDLFHEAVPDEFIDDVFAVMAEAQQHTFQVLTKRPERMLRYMSDDTLEDRVTDLWRACAQPDRETWSLMFPLKNVWLGVSVEDQPTADERIPLLLQTPAAVHFISAEPLLGPVDLKPFATEAGELHMLDWVFTGGESGPKARPTHPDWFRSLRDQCTRLGCVPFFFKQWGEWISGLPGDKALPFDREPDEFWAGSDYAAFRVGKKRAGRLLDGRTWDEFPR